MKFQKIEMDKMIEKIKESKRRGVVIHCSASPRRGDDAKDIERWHKERHFSEIGYHFVILDNGEIQEGRSLSKNGAHTFKHNELIGICFMGGTKKNDIGKKQVKTINEFKKKYMKMVCEERGCEKIDIRKEIRPHNFYARKACPNINIYNIENKK